MICINFETKSDKHKKENLKQISNFRKKFLKSILS